MLPKFLLHLPFIVAKTLSIRNTFCQLPILKDRNCEPPVPSFLDALVAFGWDIGAILIGAANVAHGSMKHLVDHIVDDRVQKVVPRELEKEIEAGRDDAVVDKLKLQEIAHRDENIITNRITGGQSGNGRAGDGGAGKG